MRAGAGGAFPLAAVCATAIALAAAGLTAQSPTGAARSVEDPLSELALRISASIAPETFISVDGSTDEQTRRDITDRLSASGIRVVDATAGRPVLRVRCADNLREHVCSAEVAGSSRAVMVVTRPRTISATPTNPAGVIELRPLVSMREPILDVAVDRDRLLVLTPAAVIRFEDDDGTWRRDGAGAIPVAGAWPRDVRGRFRVSGDRLEAFLPGVKCTADADRLMLACADSSEAWPVPIEGARLQPARNDFVTPDGRRFYGVAPLGPEAGGRWLVVASDRLLTFVDDAGARVPTSSTGDDVVAVRASCAASHVAVSSASPDRGTDLLTLFQVVRRTLLPAGSPVRLPGRMTALWPAAVGEGATVVTYDQDAARYAAHHLTVACPR